MNKKINFFIPVEVKNRELYAKILLAKYAAEKGFNVILGRKGEVNALAKYMEPGVYYGLGTFGNAAPFYSELASRGNLIAVNDEEGLVTFTDDMYLDLKVSAETLGFIDLLFTWGAENYQVIASGRKGVSSKLRITGNPRFDLLKAPFNSIYDKEMAEIRKKYPKYVLLCSSFASCNHYIRGLDYMESLIEKKVLTNKNSIEIYKRYQNLRVAAYEAFLKSIPLMAEAYPEVSFIIRKHPSESIESYEKLSSIYKNVYIDDRYSIHPWLLAAEAMVHHYCTSAVEAYTAGVPGFALRPISDPSIEKEIPYACSTECQSPEELVLALQQCLAQKTDPSNPQIKSKIDYTEYVENIGDSIASESIIEEIGKISHLFEEKNRKRSWRDKKRALIRLCKNTLKAGGRVFVSNNRDRQYISHKFDHLSTAEVIHALDVFAGENRQHFSCSLVESNVVRISYD